MKDFLLSNGVFIDVRSPKEFSHASIPNSFNIPLFDDEERARIGTLYKKEGREQAIELGLQIVGPKLYSFVMQAKELSQGAPLKLYCARGGMRSSSMSWLLNMAGVPVQTLKGGYKRFRNFVLSSFTEPLKLKVIGGLTGSGKTTLLHTLSKKGEQILDLEGLANHKGSSFGSLDNSPQPSIEQFENLIAMQLLSIDREKAMWIEDESHMIGKCKIPDPLFSEMRKAPLYFVQKSREERASQLTIDYGDQKIETLIEATKRLSKHLGLELTKQAVTHIENYEFTDAINILLDYYDAKYTHGLSKRSLIYNYE